MSAREED